MASQGPAAGAEESKAAASARPGKARGLPVPGTLRVVAYDFKADIEKIDEHRTRVGSARITKAQTCDPRVAAHILLGAPLRGVHSICGFDNNTLVGMTRRVVETGVYRGEKYVVCVCLDRLPIIGLVIDRGSYKQESVPDAFGGCVKDAAALKTDKQIPVVLINGGMPHIALMLVGL